MFKIKTCIYENNETKIVYKIGVTEEAKKHLIKMENNYNLMRKTYSDYKISKCKITNEGILLKYISGVSLQEMLLDMAEKKNKKKFFEILELYKSVVTNFGDDQIINFYYTDSFKKIFGDEILNLEKYKAFKISNIDMNLDNILMNEKEVEIIDYEWVMDFPVPIDFIIYRAIINFYFNNMPLLESFISLDEIFIFLDIKEFVDKESEIMQKKFHEYVYVENEIDYSKILDNYKKPVYDFNIDCKTYIFQVFLKRDGQYSEENSKKIIFEKDRIFEKTIILEEENLEEIRIDPINESSILKISELKLINCDNENIEYEIFYSNSLYVSEKKYIFSTNDPQLYLKFKKDKIKEIQIKIECIEIYDLDNKDKLEMLLNLFEKNDDLFGKNKNLVNKNDDLVNENEKLRIKNEELLSELAKKKEKRNIFKFIKK